jgi:hypothetical protein
MMVIDMVPVRQLVNDRRDQLVVKRARGEERIEQAHGVCLGRGWGHLGWPALYLPAAGFVLVPENDEMCGAGFGFSILGLRFTRLPREGSGRVRFEVDSRDFSRPLLSRARHMGSLVAYGMANLHESSR